MEKSTDIPARTTRSTHAHRFFLLIVVSIGYFAASISLFFLLSAGVTRGSASLPTSVLVIFACMSLSVASTACYVFLQRES